MLIIKDEQIQAFIASGDDELTGLVRQAVQAANALRVAGCQDAALEKMIAPGIKLARTHGLIRAEDIAAFVAIMFETSPKFAEQPEIAAVLRDANFPPGERLYQIFERVPDAAWQEAESLYNEEFWFSTDADTK